MLQRIRYLDGERGGLEKSDGLEVAMDWIASLATSSPQNGLVNSISSDYEVVASSLSDIM
jgi:hypothetical protein